MADANDRTLYSVKNTQAAPRGIWSDGVLTYVEGDAPVLAELTDADKALADKTGYFDIAKATAADKKAASAGDPPTTDGKPA